ncbi:hypothetical protein ADUPG1_003658, partial [Aduncisulcus paluster]
LGDKVHDVSGVRFKVNAAQGHGDDLGTGSFTYIRDHGIIGVFACSGQQTAVEFKAAQFENIVVHCNQPPPTKRIFSRDDFHVEFNNYGVRCEIFGFQQFEDGDVFGQFSFFAIQFYDHFHSVKKKAHHGQAITPSQPDKAPPAAKEVSQNDRPCKGEKEKGGNTTVFPPFEYNG